MNTKFFPYIALLLFILIGTGSWMHRRHLSNTLLAIQAQIAELDRRVLDPAEISRIRDEIAACREELTR